MNDYKMTPGELRATWGLGTVFSLRMLGMFMVLSGSDHVRYGATGASEALIALPSAYMVWRKPFSKSPLACSLTALVVSHLSSAGWRYSFSAA